MEDLKAIESAFVLGLVDEEIAEEGIKEKVENFKNKFRSKNQMTKEEFMTEYKDKLQKCREACFRIIDKADEKYNKANTIFVTNMYKDPIEDCLKFKSKKVMMALANLEPIRERSQNYGQDGNGTVNTANVKTTDIRPIFNKIVSELKEECTKHGFKVEYDFAEIIYIVIEDLYVKKK